METCSISRILSQLSTCHCSVFVCFCKVHPKRLSLLCFLERKGHFRLVTAFIPVPLSALCTVFTWKNVLVMSCKVLVTSVAFSVFWEVIRRIAYWVSAGESFYGRPPTDLEIVEWCLEWILDIEPSDGGDSRTRLPFVKQFKNMSVLSRSKWSHECMCGDFDVGNGRNLDTEYIYIF